MYCDICRCEFHMQETRVEERHLGGDIQEKYFKCPMCNAFFSIIKTDTKIRTLIKKQEYMQLKLAKKKNKATKEELELFNERQEEIKKIVEELAVV